VPTAVFFGRTDLYTFLCVWIRAHLARVTKSYRHRKRLRAMVLSGMLVSTMLFNVVQAALFQRYFPLSFRHLQPEDEPNDIILFERDEDSRKIVWHKSIDSIIFDPEGSVMHFGDFEVGHLLSLHADFILKPSRPVYYRGATVDFRELEI